MHSNATDRALAELYNLPSARTKYRRVKKAKDKRLLTIDREQTRLWNTKYSLGYEDLIPPVQRGWKRLFVLRSDVAESKHAAFYQEILDSINTVCYNQRKDFKVRKRRRRRYGYEVVTQELKTPEEYGFKRMKLTDEQRALFYATDYYCPFRKRYMVKYVFSEPWRFVLKIQPNIITKVRIKDWQLERELKLIDNHITSYFLTPKINKLKQGNAGWWRTDKKSKYNPLKGKSLTQVVYEYKQELQETNEY